MGRTLVGGGNMSGNGRVSIDSVHQKIHLGAMWVGTKEFTGLNDTDTGAIVIYPKDNSEVHMDFTASASGACKFQLFESPTESGDGAALTAYNTKRCDTRTATFALEVDPTTISSNGTELDGVQMSAGIGQGLGGIAGSRHEWILDPTKKYLVLLTSQSNGLSARIDVRGYED